MKGCYIFRKIPVTVKLRWVNWVLILSFFLTMIVSLKGASIFPPSLSSSHVYVDSEMLFAFELTPAKEAFVEIINLGEKRRCLSVERITMRTEDGKVIKFDSFLYDGNTSKLKGNPRACVRQKTQRRFELGYSFEFPKEVRKVVFLIGRQAFRLQPFTLTEYQLFVKNFEKINVEGSSEYLKIFKLRVLYGKNFYGSKIRYRRVKVSMSSNNNRSPITVLRTFPIPTKQTLKKGITSFSVSLDLDENGEVIKAVLEEAIECRFVESALYELRNWWDFSPGFKDGQPVSSKHRATVVYRLLER